MSWGWAPSRRFTAASNRKEANCVQLRVPAAQPSRLCQGAQEVSVVDPRGAQPPPHPRPLHHPPRPQLQQRLHQWQQWPGLLRLFSSQSFLALLNLGFIIQIGPCGPVRFN
jgi:hypothetical protein